jgi:hypothetical protein
MVYLFKLLICGLVGWILTLIIVVKKKKSSSTCARERKTEAVEQILGEEAVLEMNDADVDAAFEDG